MSASQENPAPCETTSDVFSKGFLQNALKIEAKGGPVPEITSYLTTLGTKPGDNYGSIIYSVDIDLSDGTKRFFVIKCYPNHPGRQEFGNTSNMFFKECEVYSKWIPELGRMQKEVFSLDEEERIHNFNNDSYSSGQARKSGVISSLDNFIIMEDLRKTYGFRMSNRLVPFDLDHMHLVIETLAKVHAISWVYRNHVESQITEKFPCLVTNLRMENMEIWSSVINANLEQAKEIFDKEFGPGNNYSASADKFAGMVEPWRIICHGDCWSNNMLFRYDPKSGKPLEIVLVDLQLPQESCVVNDLEYVFFVCTSLEFRRKHTDTLLQLYHDTFNGICDKFETPTLPGFCMDSLRFRFHRGKLLGYYLAMMVLPIILKDGNVTNMEDIEQSKDIAEAFIDICKADENALLKGRLIEVMKGMIEDGVF
ncbi:hypothetical protein Fcan01_15785 [Folsomia candida]|uniref:CHK kinase-like domain-containing protein n=1 Tax=Folsomia candida TaxID=158441 RepID=A0A226DWZ1_FOLCA|nr:hypothetical protein Fcan01_15785 [Folsomia candida]